MHSEECKYSGAKYILLCVGMVAVIACTILNIINVKKPFLRVYEEGSFNINGVSVFWGKDDSRFIFYVDSWEKIV